MIFRWFIAVGVAASFAAAAETFPVTITVDASKPTGEWKPIWRFFGADEPNYGYMKNGEKLLGELGELGSAPVYFRCHHLLTSGDGSYALKWGSTSAYKEDAKGNPVYDWTINDRIFDTYLKHGIRPFVEIGFMPEALTTHPEDYPHNPPRGERAKVDAGQAYPPKDYKKWEDLCYEWTKHCVERYGRAEVEKWYWEVWNEPNIFYWKAPRKDYLKLYDFSVYGVRRALPTARVGGPGTAGGAGGPFLAAFLEHCAHRTNYVNGKVGVPLDFISFHAKGSPVFTNGHVRMGMSSQLRNMQDAFGELRHFQQYTNTPIVMSESDPEGCAACRSEQDAYRNGTMYSSYTAASFPRAAELAEEAGVNLEGALTWAFEFEDQPPFAGFRQLMSDGIDLPVLNVFRMFGKMSGQRVAVASDATFDANTIRVKGVRGTPDVSAVACVDGKKMTVLLWHYHDDDVPGPDAAVDLNLAGLPLAEGAMELTEYRVDAEHSNSFETWKRLGSPEQLSPEQRAQLEAAGKLAEMETQTVPVNGSKAEVKLDLPRQGVSLLCLSWK